MTIEPATTGSGGSIPAAPAASRGEREQLIEDIAADYVHQLRTLGSPLIATDELAAERAEYARTIVRAVLATLSGATGESPSLDTRREVLELVDSGIGPTVALSGAALLFEVALLRLHRALPHESFEIAICLARHLLFGIALVLDSARVAVRREDLATEFVDSSLLRATLSKREAAVFMLLLDRATTDRIASRLGIEKVTVKHHITNIGRKLGGRGRAQVIRRARELGILVAAPLSASATITVLNALTSN